MPTAAVDEQSECTSTADFSASVSAADAPGPTVVTMGMRKNESATVAPPHSTNPAGISRPRRDHNHSSAPPSATSSVPDAVSARANSVPCGSATAASSDAYERSGSTPPGRNHSSTHEE